MYDTLVGIDTAKVLLDLVVQNCPNEFLELSALVSQRTSQMKYLTSLERDISQYMTQFRKDRDPITLNNLRHAVSKQVQGGIELSATQAKIRTWILVARVTLDL